MTRMCCQSLDRERCHWRLDVARCALAQLSWLLHCARIVKQGSRRWYRLDRYASLTLMLGSSGRNVEMIVAVERLEGLLEKRGW